jgi:isoaspartyl peptidase/L-asparaginase-like protein (Ntn-hydrolase superfamily)
VKIFFKIVTLFSLLSFSYAGTDGTIRGKVTDIDGNPLPGANIYVPDVGIGAAAGGDGGYIILNIPVGDYDVVVQMMGYQKQTMTQVSVMMDQTAWLNFKLPIAAV